MRIERGVSDAIQPKPPADPREIASPAGPVAPAQPVPPVSRPDRVEISDAGRALAAGETGTGVTAERAELSAERLAELRQRVLSGAYNSTEMVDQVARRLLESGDV
ncbi:MAG TPA: flagellar biosynthesis anti-sigma factor FlgM [Gemmatimonadaceae bacterium]|jgi:hypothetical protein|nr:flagellar biosynthesis anti-sigma factor FlgM [Gemmatimonadaceae bacterium]